MGQSQGLFGRNWAQGGLGASTAAPWGSSGNWAMGSSWAQFAERNMQPPIAPWASSLLSVPPAPPPQPLPDCLPCVRVCVCRVAQRPRIEVILEALSSEIRLQSEECINIPEETFGEGDG